MVRPLKPVNSYNLIPGITYLIQDKQQPHRKFKGQFVKNDLLREHTLPNNLYYNMTYFTNVICSGNFKRSDLVICEKYWNYYEADAIVLAYTNHILQKLISDLNYIN